MRKTGQKYNFRMFNRVKRKWIIPVLIVLLVGVFYLPPVYTRVVPRISVVREKIKNLIDPPEDVTFNPSGQSSTQTANGISSTQTPNLTTSKTQSSELHPTLTPTITSTPVPEAVNLTGIRYEDQKNRWNYCGPANLSMSLNYLGWDGNRDTVAASIKPGVKDPKLDFIQQGRTDINVMPYELVDFVNYETEFRALSRLGGNIDLIKKLIAADFPPIVEKGYYEKDFQGKVSWLGHYQFVTGYDDVTHEVIVQDTWNDGPNFHISYDDFSSPEAWLAFDNIFIVVYAPEREGELLEVLGQYADSQWAAGYALSVADEYVRSSSGIDQYFAWFAKGTSHIALQQYVDAATAFDQAFIIYNNLGEDDLKRPYRMMWYQTGPYWAYFYSGRYQDVIDLADVALSTPAIGPVLEESIYWRGRAYYIIGNTPAAIKDYREALRLHPNWPPAIQALQDLGIQP